MMIDSIESNKGEFNNSFFLFLGINVTVIVTAIIITANTYILLRANHYVKLPNIA